MYILYIVIAVFFALLIAYVIYYEVTEKKAALKRQDEEDRRERKRQEALEFNKVLESLQQQYGETRLIIPLLGSLNRTHINNYMVVFEEAGLIMLCGSMIPFEKIISYSLNDSTSTISKTEGTASTRASTGSMVGRSAVGGLLFGEIGALAGASTADRDTEISTVTTHETSHDYTIYLSVDDLASPRRVIRFGRDVNSAQTAASVFNIILKRNSDKN